jgi:hypothetical protein
LNQRGRKLRTRDDISIDDVLHMAAAIGRTPRPRRSRSTPPTGRADRLTTRVLLRRHLGDQGVLGGWGYSSGVFVPANAPM